jgi:hypothetical protein
VRVVAVGESIDNSFAVYPTVLAPGEALHYALGGAIAQQADGTELMVYTLTGQCLGTQRLGAGAAGQIHLSPLPAGWYLARLRLPNGHLLNSCFGVK